MEGIPLVHRSLLEISEVLNVCLEGRGSLDHGVHLVVVLAHLLGDFGVAGVLFCHGGFQIGHLWMNAQLIS